MKRLLAIVDDWERLERYEEILIADFEVHAAPFGGVGIAHANESHPEVILIDLAFEDMDEFEAKTQIREQKSLESSLLVVICNADSAFGREAMDATMTTKPELVLYRPISVEEVGEKILEAIKTLRM